MPQQGEQTSLDKLTSETNGSKSEGDILYDVEANEGDGGVCDSGITRFMSVRGELGSKVAD